MTTEKKVFELIEKGLYGVKFNRAEIKLSQKNPKNMYLDTELEILDGKFKGYRVWEPIVLTHETSVKAREIGGTMLDSALKGVGVADGIESLGGDFGGLGDLLVGKETIANVYIKASDNPQYPNSKNRVYRFQANA